MFFPVKITETINGLLMYSVKFSAVVVPSPAYNQKKTADMMQQYSNDNARVNSWEPLPRGYRANNADVLAKALLDIKLMWTLRRCSRRSSISKCHESGDQFMIGY